MVEDCVDKGNLGLVRCNKLPAMLKGMITTPPGFSITEANAALPAFWQSRLQDVRASRLYLWPEFDKVEDVSTDAAYDESPLSELVADPGKYKWKAMISQNLCTHKAMFTHSGKGDRVFLWDVKNNLIGTRLSNGNFAGFKLSLLNAEKLKFGNGSEGTYSPVYIVLRDHLELDKNGMMLSGNLVNELTSIIDVTLTIIGTPSSSAIVVEAELTCDGTALVGLIAADFLVLTTAGGAQAKTSLESTTIPGRYTLTASTSFTDGTLALVPSASISVKAYESVAAVAIDVP